MKSMSPEQLQDALPWYVNGTLAFRNVALVEEALRDDAHAREVLTFLRDISEAVKLTPRFNEQVSLARLLERIQDEPLGIANRTSAPSNARSSWNRLQSLFEPKLALALLVVVVQAVVIVRLSERAEPNAYSEFRSPASPVTQQERLYRVTFKPNAPEGEIRKLLILTGSMIVYGPTQLGDYYLTVLRANSERSKALETSPMIESIEAIERLPVEAPDTNHTR
jgi:hypothetical protein